MQHDAWFFVGILGFVFLVWAATGGPSRPLSWAGPSLAQPQELGGGTYLRLPRSPFTIAGSHTSLPGSSDSRTTYTRYSGSGSLYGIDFGTPSPFRSLVTLTRRVVNASSTNPNLEYLSLAVPTTAREHLTITNWQFVSEVTGNAALIPSGTPLPLLGKVSAVAPITLRPGDRATIFTGRSPIGVSFRENKCTGYLNSFQAFTPALTQRCPLPVDELVNYYGDYYVRDTTCLDYVKKLPRCGTVFFPKDDISARCENFVLTHLNYNGCVATHRDDTDFEGTTWRIYLNMSDALWRGKDELIKLWDAGRKTVDAFSY